MEGGGVPVYIHTHQQNNSHPPPRNISHLIPVVIQQRRFCDWREGSPSSSTEGGGSIGIYYILYSVQTYTPTNPKSPPPPPHCFPAADSSNYPTKTTWHWYPSSSMGKRYHIPSDHGLRSQGVTRNVVYLGWPIAPSYMSPNRVRGGGGVRGLSQWVHSCAHGAQINSRDLTPYLT